MSRDRIIQVYRGTTAQNDAFTGAAGEITMDTTRKELRVHDGSTAGGNLVGLKPGFVCPFAGTTAPDGWLICDGSAVSRTTYADLFAVIGTTYGAGDGNSTFNLPTNDLNNLVRFTTLVGHGMTQLSSGAWTEFTATADCLLRVTGSNGYAMISISQSTDNDQVLDRTDVTSSSVCSAIAYIKKGQTVYMRATGNNRYYVHYDLMTTKEIQCIKY